MFAITDNATIITNVAVVMASIVTSIAITCVASLKAASSRHAKRY